MISTSPTVSTGGDRFSPKITVGVTPVAGFTPYVSYAEGYRAPSITETLIAGEPCHRRRSDRCSSVRTAPPDLFCFLPNPGLRPEVGKNKEAGVNLKYDGIFTADDSFRGKFNVFRNDVDDYIDLVGVDAEHAHPGSGPRPVQPVLPVPEHRTCQDRGRRGRGAV